VRKKKNAATRIVRSIGFIGQYALFLSITLACAFAQPAGRDKQSFSERLALSTDAVSTRRFVAVHGQRSVIMGYPEKGLEVWAYPFQILSDYQIGFRPVGATTESDGRLLLRRVIYQPDSITRIYIGPDYLVRERLFVPLDKPAAIFSYEVESAQPLDIQVHFVPVLNLMWPAALGGQNTQWNSDLSGYIISEPLHGPSAIVASHDIVSHDGTVNSTLRTDGQLSFSVRPRAATKGGPTIATVYAALEATGSDDAVTTIRDISAHQAEMQTRAAVHYDELESTSLQIHTPDENVNRALAWAEVALDQSWVCNPQLGCGITAGYGPARDARRPQYDWFFAGDGMVATNALVSAGEYSRAREELVFIAKYQDKKTGMIWHELSQSAGYLDWSKYPYMFVHVDISFDYLNTVARYVSVSGDNAFATDHWASIAAAYRYCQSIIRPSDNLPHIPADKEGGDEQDRPDDDLGLSSSWVSATAGFAQLAKLNGNMQLAEEAIKANQLARKSMATHYWDSVHRYWIDGHTQTGAPIIARRSGPTETISQNIFSPQQNNELLNQLASSDFQTDWGMRGVGAGSGIFDPYSYSKGSISALGTTEKAVTFWMEHRPATAFAIWSGILPWNTLDSLGHIHEVVAGTFFHEQVESVPEQTWSSAGFLDSAIRGLLGLKIDGTLGRINFSPHLPAEWDHVSVENVHLPHSMLDLSVARTLNDLDLEIRNLGAPTKMLFEPQIPLGAHLIGAECQDRPIVAGAEVFPEEEQAKLEFEVPSGTSRCRLRFQGGVFVILGHPTPQIGDPSTGMKLTNFALQNKILSIDADVHQGVKAKFRVQTPWKIAGSTGATFRALSEDLYEVTLQEPSSQANLVGYAHAHAETTFVDR
jgi:glycogen debranching enzyme